MQEASIFLLGSVLASFVSCIAMRGGLKFAVFGRSKCDGCNKQLVYWQLIPIISWLLVKGKCNNCHQPISLLYLTAELLLGLWFISCWSLDFSTVYYLFGLVSVYLAIWDWLKLQVPIDGLVILTALAVFTYYRNGCSYPLLILLLPLGFISLTVMMYKIKQLPCIIPWGDVWALATLAVWIDNPLEFLILASSSALLMSRLLSKTLSPHIPLIPAICIATAINIVCSVLSLPNV